MRGWKRRIAVLMAALAIVFTGAIGSGTVLNSGPVSPRIAEAAEVSERGWCYLTFKVLYYRGSYITLAVWVCNN